MPSAPRSPQRPSRRPAPPSASEGGTPDERRALDAGSQVHDSFFKDSFGRLEVAADLVARYLPSDVVAALDLGSLSLEAGSFVDERLRTRHSDLLFRVRLRAGGEAYLYLILEHKSTVDRLVPLQLLGYCLRIWERDARQAGRSRRPLRPILPVVIYHGRRSWTAPLSLGELIDASVELEPWLPDFRYQLIDLQERETEAIVGGILLRIALLTLQAIFRPDLPLRLAGVARLLQRLGDRLLIIQELNRLLNYAERAGKGLSRAEIAAVAEAGLPGEGETMAMTYTRQILNQGLTQGLTQGRLEGLRSGIEAVLDIRFGAAGLALMDRIRHLDDPVRLEDLLQAVRREPSLDAVRRLVG